MKRNRLITFIITLSLILGLVGIQPGTVYAADAPAVLGGQQTTGCLRINISNGNIDVYRYDGNTFVRQYYTAADAILDVNGRLYALGTYFNPSMQMPISSQVANAQTVVTTWRTSGFELTQTVTLPTNTAQYIQLEWSVKNIGSTPMTNLHFLRGEDTFLAGGDNGAGYWDGATNSIGVSKVVNGVTQRLYMQGITIPNSYMSTFYGTVRADVGNGGELSKEINPNEGTDNGYALEWKNAVLNPDEAWTIRANECFVSSAVLANGSSAVTSVSGGAITVGYTVTNSSSIPQPVSYTVEGPEGWTVVPDITSDIIAPNSQGTVNVTVTPQPDAAGGTYNIILNISTQDSTSQSISTVTIAEPLTAPAVTADDVNNILVGTDNTMEYSTDGGAVWNACNSSNPPVFEGNQTVLVRVKATAVTPVSESTTVSFTQPAAPNITVDDENDTIAGINDTMEYSMDGGTVWNACDSSNPPVFRGNQTVQVRVKATAENDASAAVILIFHAAAAADDVNNVLDNVDSSMEYSTDNGAGWASYDPDNVPTFAGGTTVLVRKKAGDSVKIDFTAHSVSGSAISVVTGSAISISGSAVSVSGSAVSVSGSAISLTGSALAVDFTNHKMAATDDTMEYSEDNGSSWKDCAPASEINVAEDTIILVRKKAGSIREVTFTDNPAVPSSPSVSVDDQSNTIIGADNTLEYSTDSGRTWTDYNAENSPAFTGNKTVEIRKKAGEPVRINYVNGSITGSDINVVSGSASSATGSAITVTADFTNKKLIGVYENMEYSTDNGRTWTSCTSSTLDFSGDTVVLLRKKAGEITTLHFTANPPAAPSVRNDDSNNTIIGADASMEYSIDGGRTWTGYDENNPPEFTGTVDVKIRVKASGANPAGEITTLHFYSNPNSNPNSNPSADTGSSKSDENTKRQVEVSLDSTPAASVDILRTEENNKAVDSVTVDQKAVEETLKSKKDSADKLGIYINGDEKNPADEIHFNIKADALKMIADSDLDVEIKSDDVTITLSKDGLQKLADQEKDLYFRVIPIKGSTEKEAAIKDTLSSELVKEYANYKTIGVFGTPMTIETNYENQKTDVVFSARNITLPEDPALKEKVLSNMAVYVMHSDGDKEILPGTLLYNEDGTLAGVKLTINKFSTFNFISTINTAPSILKLAIKKADKSGKILEITYSYEDADQDKEGKTKYQWYYADNNAGKNKTKIASADKSTYEITGKDQGKYLICEVIPFAKEGAITGKSYTAVKYVPLQEPEKEPSKKAETKAGNSIVKDTASKSGAAVKLGLIGSKKYAEELGDIFNEKYQAINVKVEQEGRYYRVSAEFATGSEAEKACKDLKNKHYIINYDITGMTAVKQDDSKTNSGKISAGDKNKAQVKLGLVGSEKYAKQLADIFRNTYKAGNVVVKAEGNYYRVSAEFLNKAAAEEACQEMKYNQYIINYYISVKK